MMILIPGMAYVGMLVLMQYNQDHNLFPIPMDMINKTAGDPLLFIKISVVLVLMLVLYAILMMVTFLLNKIFTPSQLGPFDVPAKRIDEDDDPKSTLIIPYSFRQRDFL